MVKVARMMMDGIVCAAIVTSFFFGARNLLIKKNTYTYKTTNEVYNNPLMGFAPNADYIDAVGDSSLVYLEITWKELEPEEGKFDFDSIESKNYLSRWKADGKKVVFRFISDDPSDKKHMDIPNWLYQKTRDGSYYDSSYGKGYSPNYNNDVFIKYHKKAIEALGKRYGEDSFFAYIELGSIGHWGEWHVKYKEGLPRIPSETVCKKYVKPYISAFPNAKLLMRRPFSYVKNYGLGVYNDMVGYPSDTKEWLSWIAKGGKYTQPKKSEKLIAYPNIWNDYPVGGEFTSALTMKNMLVTNLDRTCSLIGKSHMTFAGPMCPIANKEQQRYPEACKKVLRNMGYRYTVTSATTEYNKLSHKLKVSIKIKNNGVAPLYFKWPVYIYALDDNGNIASKYLTNINLTKITKNVSKTGQVSISGDFENGIPQLAVGIEDPDTNMPAISMNMETIANNKIYYLN